MHIWCQFRIKSLKIAAEIVSSNRTIWDESSEQH